MVRFSGSGKSGRYSGIRAQVGDNLGSGGNFESINRYEHVFVSEYKIVLYDARVRPR